MRTDESVSRDSFRFSDEWKRSEGGAELTPEIDSRLAGGEMRNGRYVAHSLSGNERNKLFMNSAGKSFSDMSHCMIQHNKVFFRILQQLVPHPCQQKKERN